MIGRTSLRVTWNRRLLTIILHEGAISFLAVFVQLEPRRLELDLRLVRQILRGHIEVLIVLSAADDEVPEVVGHSRAFAAWAGYPVFPFVLAALSKVFTFRNRARLGARHT